MNKRTAKIVALEMIADHISDNLHLGKVGPIGNYPPRDQHRIADEICSIIDGMKKRAKKMKDHDRETWQKPQYMFGRPRR